MSNKRYILMIIGSIVLVVVAFFFLSRALSWNYVSDLVKDHDDPKALIDPPAEPEKSHQFTLSVNLDENQYQLLMQLLVEMDELYPRIHVDITNYYEDKLTYKSWSYRMQLDELGDIQLIPNEWILPLAIQGQLLPVDRLMSSESISALLPGLVDALKWNGYTWGMPYWNNPYFIVYRKDVVTYLETNENSESAEDIENQDSSALNLQVDENSDNSDETIDESEGNLSLPASNQQEVKSSSSKINVERLHELQMLTNYIEQLYPDDKIMNIDLEHYNNFLIWSTYWNGEQLEGINLEHNSEGDKAFRQWLIEHQSMISESNQLSSDHLPLIYMATWSDYSKEKDLLDEYYEMKTIQTPIPWINGESFIIQAGSDESSVMVEWLEKLIQLASAQSFNAGGIPTRSLDYMVRSDKNYSYILNALKQKLENKQIIQVAPNWPETYEKRKLLWSSQQDLTQKLFLFEQ